MNKNKRTFFKKIFSSLFLINFLLIMPYKQIQYQIIKFKKRKNKDLIWYLDENDK